MCLNHSTVVDGSLMKITTNFWGFEMNFTCLRFSENLDTQMYEPQCSHNLKWEMLLQ